MSHSSGSPELGLAFSAAENQSQEELSEEIKLKFLERSNKFLSNLCVCVKCMQLIQTVCVCTCTRKKDELKK